MMQQFTPSTALVILAAGIGRRYGAAKQLEPVGPDGSTLMEYSVFDAVRAGFDRVVLVIAPDMADTFAAHFHQRMDRAIRIDVAPQLTPAFRTKPWGTAHAVLSAASLLATPFAVINADDFYGRASFDALAAFLRTEPAHPVPAYAMVAFRLRDTLPDAGAVSRALCDTAPDGSLARITEFTSIERLGHDAQYMHETGARRTISGDALVSMNMWGFSPRLFADLQPAFDAFQRNHRDDPAAEFYLPAFINDLVSTRRARVTLLPARDNWCGLTRRQDLAVVNRRIRDRIARGEYPEDLWT